MNKIQQLSPGVIKKLRSGIAFMNVAHCVEELVLNSIDAGASCIAVNVNLPVYQVQVIDNGNGIDLEEMKIIGTRYATSKCHKLEDLQNLKSGGFRGEALSSLKEVSSVLMIESRPASSTETYCKIFTQGKALDPKRSVNSRPSKGTSVTVYDFMYNLPVRRKSISDALDLEECRKILQTIALMHPNVSFTLKNEATGEMSLQLKKSSSLYHCFTQIFGGSRACNLKNIDYHKSDYAVSGCISIDCHVSKDLQFLYVNKRQVLRTKIHKLINSILNKVLSSRQKSNVQVSRSNLMPDTSSPVKNQCYCIFAFNISCPYDKYDIIFEPRKTIIEFSDWDSVLKVVELALTEFLKSQNLSFSAEETEVDVINTELIQDARSSNFNVQDCRQGLFSHVVRRLFEVDNSGKNSPAEIQLKESSASDNGDFSSISKEQLASNCRDENSSLALLKNQVQSSVEPGASSKNSQISVSLMDNYRSAIEIDSALKSKEVESDIPRRTVFPSENPVMLRIPVKSSLSDLQSRYSSSNLRKLKDKIQCFARKEKTLLITNKPDKQCEQSIGFNNALNSSSKSISLENSPVLSFNAGKYEVKLKEFRNPNLRDKSSQCPSVSQCQKVTKDVSSNALDLQERPVARITSDKSLQCPSVSVVKPAKVVSRFQFREDATILNLKCLKQSKRLQKQAFPEDFIAVSQNILDNVDSDTEFTVTKKFKSSHCISRNDSPVSPDQSKENKDMELNTSGVSEVRVSTEECINDFHAYGSPNTLELFNGSSSVSRISERLNKTSILSPLNLSCLQTFMQSKNAKTIAQDLDGSAELKDDDSSREIELFYISDDDNDTNRHELSSSQTFSPFRIPAEILDCVKEIEKEVCDMADRNMNLNFNDEDGAENMVTDASASDKNISSENSSVHSLFLVSPMLNNNDSTNVSNAGKNYLSNFQTTNSCSIDNGIVKQNQIESSGFSVPQDMIDNDMFSSSPVKSELNQKHAQNHLLTSDAKGFKETSDVNFESYPFNECLPFFPEKLSSESDKKSQKNHDSEKESNCLSQELFKDLTSEISGTVEASSHVDDPREPNSSNILHPCSSKNEFDKTGASNSGLKNKDLMSLNHWELQSEPKTKRKIYVDTVTGNSTYVAPEVSADRHTNQDVHLNNGVSKKSHFFLSHDFSPFVAKTQTPKDKDKINKPALLNDLRNFIENHDKQEKHVKWRNSQDDSKCNDNNIENMLSAWDNPMFDVPYEETSINSNKISQNVCQMYSFLNSYKFSKNSLDSLQVIGQVDCKFIACILTDFNEDCKGNKLLALFDQHAVHERIRLEEIIEDLYEADRNGGRSVRTVAINPPLEISLSDEEVRLLSTYHEKLHKIGIYIKIDSDAHLFSVYSVPSCLVHKETGELRRSLPDSISILQNSASEWLSSLVKTRSVPQVLPKTLLSVLNYQACRGAVKFGDPLTLEQCRDLLKALSGCKLPFQCAHGRPSIAPLLDLKKIEALYKKRPAPQLKALSSQFQQ